MEKQHRLIIFAVLAVATLFLFGCLEFISERNVTGIIKKTKPNETFVNVTNATNDTGVITSKTCEDLITGKEDCIMQRAYDNNKHQECSLLNDPYYRQCMYKVAEVSYSNCLYFKNSSDADDCLVNVSSKTGDAACSVVINETKKTACMLQTISADCRSIANANQRYSCDAIARNNESICTKSTDPDSCYMDFSMNKTDVCSRISSESTRAACKGVLANNTGPCSGITTGQIVRDSCYKIYAAKKKECISCEMISDSVYKDDCYAGCAVASGDYLECSKPSDESKRDNCYWKYSLNTTNVSICNEVKYKSLARLCIEQVGVLEAKPSDCEKIKLIYTLTQEDVSNCYMAVVTGSNSSFGNCQLMNDGYWKDLCTDHAIKRENMSSDYCAYIIDSMLRSDCNKR